MVMKIGKGSGKLITNKFWETYHFGSLLLKKQNTTEIWNSVNMNLRWSAKMNCLQATILVC